MQNSFWVLNRELALNSAPWFELACGSKDKGHKDCPGDVNATNLTVYGALGSRSSVIFDIEGDGDLDIIANEFNSPPLVLVSDLADKANINSIKVNLVGRASNRNGFGAKVEVKAGEKTYHAGRERQIRLYVAKPFTTVFRPR